MAAMSAAISVRELATPPPASAGSIWVRLDQRRFRVRIGQVFGVALMHECAVLRDPNPKCVVCRGCVQVNGFVKVDESVGPTHLLSMAPNPPGWPEVSTFINPLLCQWHRIGADPIIIVRSPI